ncbi:MAG: hypothetical protein DYG89_24905 [Caldilinea sp. CFX5]|nr:hypothetical protein [Caldilinea sp. CFX5]
MIDQIMIPPVVHLSAGTLVLLSNLALLAASGWLAWRKKAFTAGVQLLFVLFQLTLLVQALVGVKLLDQGLGVLQLYIHYVGGLAPLAFCLLLSWLPDKDLVTKSRRVALLAGASLLFVVLTFAVGSMYVGGV